MRIKPSILRLGTSITVMAALALVGLMLVPEAVTVASSKPGYELKVSVLADRSGAIALSGTALSGDRFVFLTPTTNLTTVSFWLDDPTMKTAPLRTERLAAFDFWSTAADHSALPWNTRTAADGRHTISASAVTRSGSVSTSATFTVANATPASTATPTATPAPTAIVTPTPTPVATPTLAPPTGTPTPTPVATPTLAPPTATPAPTAIATPTVAPQSGPRITNVAATNVTTSGALVSWSLDVPATGQVEFGKTTAYGQLTTPELSYTYTAHRQQLSGLTLGTLYHFRVKSQDATGHMSISGDGTFLTLGGTATPTPAPTATPAPTPAPTTTPTPTPAPTATPAPTPAPTATPAPGATGIYGAAFNFDTKANLQVGWTDHAQVAHRFVASTTSALVSVRFQQRGGPIYSGGTGGTLRITVRPDDGAGHPASTVLASATYAPGNPSGGWTTYDAVTFGSPATLSKGTRYYIVFEDVDANPVANYISVNELFVYGSTLTPRQPAFADNDYAVLYAAPTSWSVQGKYTADMDLTYSNGAHDGMAYVQNMTEYYGTISGTASVREHFTVSGGNRTVTKASVRVRRSGGSSPLTIRLETSAGALIEAVDVPASAVPVSAAGGDNGGSVWVTVTFDSAHNLANGTAYNLRLTTPAGTTYTAAPIREGTDVGLHSVAFRDGSGQRSSNGTSWADLYAYSPVDLQFYFR